MPPPASPASSRSSWHSITSGFRRRCTIGTRTRNAEFDDGAFSVVAETTDWAAPQGTRRAGVSSFGVGGTNVHAVLEEAPTRSRREPTVDHPVVLPVSAKSGAAVADRWRDLAEYLGDPPSDLSLDDVAQTLARGRMHFDHRSHIVARTIEEAAEAAQAQALQPGFKLASPDPSVAFLFPGQGAVRLGMGRQLYAADDVFRSAFERCIDIAAPFLDRDLRSLVFEEGTEELLGDARYVQPALFAIEYALAEVWASLGILPVATMSLGIGEYVAACRAGVFTLDDAIELVCARGRLMRGTEPGAVPAPIIAEFERIVGKVTLDAPRSRFISAVTGTWITAEEATDPAYWSGHMRGDVRFVDGVKAMLDSGVNTFVEVGPGRDLSELTRVIVGSGGKTIEVIASLPEPSADESHQLLEAVGAAWSVGAKIEWQGFRSGPLRRVPLPTYPFQRSRHWVGPEVDQDQTQQRGVNVTGTITTPQAVDSEARMAESKATVRTSEDRVPRVLNELLEIFRNMSGLEIASSDVDTRFQDLGFDSLFLAQANAELRTRFNVRIGFRQLLDEASTPAALARFIDAAMPPEAPALEAVAPLPEPVSASHADGAAGPGVWPVGDPLSQPIASIRSLVGDAPDGLMGVAQKHLELMEAQLRLLRDAGVRSPTQAVPATTRTAAEVPDRESTTASFAPVPVTTGAAPAPKPSAELSDRQREGIATLVARYGKRTRKSKEFAEDARVHLADNRAVVGYRTAWKDLAYQVVTAGSKGSRLQDIDGNDYIDVMNSMGANLLGHRFEPIVNAIESLLHQGFEVGPQIQLAREVAEKVCAMTGAERLTFAHTGCEAVQYAVRMARAATGRDKVMFFEGDVHGRGDLFIARSFELDGQLRTMPTAPGVPRASVAESMVMQYGSERALETLRSMGSDIAAVLVEPVRTRNPDLQPVEFLRAVRRITEEMGICLIFDEVVTGFRVHPGGAQAYFDIDADIATYGKVLGGGLPIGAVAGRREFLDYADGGMWSFGDDTVPESAVTRVGGTMVKHPLSLAAAKAVLETLEEAGPDLQRELNRRTTVFAEQLNARFAENGVPIHVEQFASYFKPVFMGSPEFEPLLYAHLRDRGVHAYADFPCFFTAAHTEEEISQVADAFVDAAAEMAEYGLLDQRPQQAGPTPVQLGHSDEGIVTGSVPLLPNQYRFLVERESPHPNSWGIFGVRTCRVRLDEDHLRAACALLIRQHDALRTRLISDGDDWHVYFDEPHAELPFSVHRMDIDDAAEAEQLVEDEAIRLRDSIVLSEGPLMRMALFDFGDVAPQRLYLMINHLASDGLSWIRLWEDLEDAYDHVSRGVEWHPAKTESFRTWAHRLDALAQEQATIERADDWLALPWESVSALPQDFDVDAAANTNGSVSVLQEYLDADVSHALDRVRVDYRADLLVGAVAEAVSEWSGGGAVLMDVLGHGREEDLFDDADVSRTVGFFAWYTPYVLQPGPSGADLDWTTTMLPQIDAIRQKGALTHDLLRYLCRDDDVSRRMRALPSADILVNWQGRFDGVFPETQLFDDHKDPGRASDMPDGKRAYLLSIRGDIIDKQWVVTFVYSENIHQESTIGELAERVRQALEQVAHVKSLG